MKLSIRKKLLGLTFFATVIPLLVVAGVIWFVVTQKTYEDSIDKISTYSNIANKIYKLRMNNIKKNLEELSVLTLQFKYIDVLEGNKQNITTNSSSTFSSKEVENVFSVFKAKNGLDFLDLIDEKGNVLYRVNNPSKKGESIYSMEPSIGGKAFRSKKIIYGTTKLERDFISFEKLDNFLDLGAGKSVNSALSIEVAVPIVYKNKVYGMLLGGDVLNKDTNLVDKFKELVFGKSFKSGAATIYMDNISIASSRGGKFGRALGVKLPEKIYSALKSTGEPFIGPETINGVDFISEYIPIKDSENRIVGVYSVNVEQSWFKRIEVYLRNVVALVIGLAILFALIITFILARKFTKPIEEIKDAANRISLGDMDVEVSIKTGDELESLADSIERMRLSLRAAIERLRKR